MSDIERSSIEATILKLLGLPGRSQREVDERIIRADEWLAEAGLKERISPEERAADLLAHLLSYSRVIEALAENQIRKSLEERSAPL